MYRISKYDLVIIGKPREKEKAPPRRSNIFSSLNKRRPMAQIGQTRLHAEGHKRKHKRAKIEQKLHNKRTIESPR